MAITTTVRIESGANAGIPSSYVPTTLPSLTSPSVEGAEVELAVGTIENANATTALGNMVTDLTTYLNSTYNPNVLKLDATDTIAANVTVRTFVRSRDESNDLLPGNEVYVLQIKVEWE